MEPEVQLGWDDDYVFAAEQRDWLLRADIRERPVPLQLRKGKTGYVVRRLAVARLGDLAPLRLAQLAPVNFGGLAVKQLRAWVASAVVDGAAEARATETSETRDSTADARAEPVEAVAVARSGGPEERFLVPEPHRDAMSRAPGGSLRIPVSELSVRTRNVLGRQGLVTFGAIARLRRADVLRIRGLGVKSVDELERRLPDLFALAQSEARARALGAIPVPSIVKLPAAAATPPAGDVEPDVPVMDRLPAALRDRLLGHRELLDLVPGGDPRFGVPGLKKASLGDVLAGSVGLLPRSFRDGTSERLQERLEMLVARIERPIPLQQEIDELFPPVDRNARIVRMRVGLDGRGPKTLEETGREFDLTRERVRQIEKKVKKRWTQTRAFLPSARALCRLLEDLGGAAYEPQLGLAAQEAGLVTQPEEVLGLLGLVDMGLLPAGSVTRARFAGSPVLSLGDQDLRELGKIGQVTGRLLSRRGIVSIAEVLADLEAASVASSEAEVRRFIAQSGDIEYLGEGEFFWRPLDDASTFAGRIHKPLTVLGPLSTRALVRVLKRSRRGRLYGTNIPLAVLEEALARAPYVVEEPGSWRWVGPASTVSLGIAEAPLLDLLREEGPALTGTEINLRLPGIDRVTLALALSSSPLFDRVAYNVYSIAGAPLLPGDVADAVARARAIPPAVVMMGANWEGGRFVVRWRLNDVRQWTNVLPIRAHAGRVVQGEWELRGADRTWKTTVDGGSIWGGVPAWVATQAIDGPVCLALRFALDERTIAPELEPL